MHPALIGAFLAFAAWYADALFPALLLALTIAWLAAPGLLLRRLTDRASGRSRR